MPSKKPEGVWVTYQADGTPHAVYDKEIAALRGAVQIGGRIGEVPFGETLAEADGRG